MDSSPWLAVHVHVANPYQIERLVRHVLPEAIQALGDSSAPWFFIRYGEGGSHLRLRARAVAPDNFKAATDILRRAAYEERDATKDGSSHGWPLASGPGVPEDGFLPPGTTVTATYSPETGRYGGPLALQINEGLFCISSRLALQVVNATSTSNERRVAIALSLLLATASALHDDVTGAAAFLQRHADAWEAWPHMPKPDRGDLFLPLQAAQARGAFERLSSPEARATTRTTAAHWRAALVSACRRFEDFAAQGSLLVPSTGAIARSTEHVRASVASMLASQMHMFCNRLGFGPAQELLWCRSLAGALSGRDIPAVSTPPNGFHTLNP